MGPEKKGLPDVFFLKLSLNMHKELGCFTGIVTRCDYQIKPHGIRLGLKFPRISGHRGDRAERSEHIDQLTEPTAESAGGDLNRSKDSGFMLEFLTACR